VKLTCLNPDCLKPNEVEDDAVDFFCTECSAVNAAEKIDRDGIKGIFTVKAAVADDVMVYGACTNPECIASHSTVAPLVPEDGKEPESYAPESPVEVTCPECGSGKRAFQRFQY